MRGVSEKRTAAAILVNESVDEVLNLNVVRSVEYKSVLVLFYFLENKNDECSSCINQ